MAEQRPTYHIIGGGVAGLSAARFLASKHARAKIILYEAASHLGGRAYSFFYPRWNMSLDNATHVIIGANKSCLGWFGKNFCSEKILFKSIQESQAHPASCFYLPEIAQAVFNTPFSQISWCQWGNVAKQLFPFTQNKLRAGFSRGNLTPLLIEKLSSGVTEIRNGWKLSGYHAQENRISDLIFGETIIPLAPQDEVISALDSYHYGKIFNQTPFEYSCIVNIYYRTSMPISLPQGSKMLGLCGSSAQWIFSSSGLLAVTISCADDFPQDDDVAARLIWKEICHLRHHVAAFMPEYVVLRYKRATLLQNKSNNSRRPHSARTVFQNLQICGDWTMKNYPCCLESAIRSAYRLR